MPIRHHAQSTGKQALRYPSVRRWSARIGFLVVFAFSVAAAAQGGPPFRTDDPETPGNQHWEINFGFIGARNPAAGAYQVPDFDINYGLGDRIQLKYEIPIALEENRSQSALAGQPATPGNVIGGIGESLLGIKWRFYEHHPNDPILKDRFGTDLHGLLGLPGQREPPEVYGEIPDAEDIAEADVNLSVSTYPQLFLNNPTSAVRRGLVASGRNFFLPLEVNGRIGPVRFDGEVGYNFGNRSVPRSWNRGLLVGHEFGERTEAYVELYDEQDATRIPSGRGIGNFATGGPKLRQTTLGLGGRQALNMNKTVNLLLMAGRSFQNISRDNDQPSWIAYVGIQILLGPKGPTTTQVEQKLPNETSNGKTLYRAHSQ